MSDAAPPQETPEQKAAREAAENAAREPNASAASATVPAAAAAASEAQRQNPGLSDAEAEKIGERAADGVIKRLEDRGVFDEPTPPPVPAPAPTPAPGENAGETPPAPGADDEPKKRSFAQRFMGLDS